jgi:hypothetical protein
VGDRPFVNLDDDISQQEPRALSEEHKNVAGFSLSDISADKPRGVPGPSATPRSKPTNIC